MKRMTRSRFLKNAAISLLGISGGNLLPINRIMGRTLDKKGNNNDNTLRSISYNVFNGCIGYKGINGHDLPEGPESKLVRRARELGQIPYRIALELALYDANIISFSEAPVESVVAQIADLLGMNYAYFPSSDYQGSFPGAILSTYKIASYENRPFIGKGSRELFTRHWGKAILHVPSTNELLSVHSSHLWYKGDEEGTKVRLKEIEELNKAINFDLKNNVKSVLLQGDLNHRPDTPEYKALNDGGSVDIYSKVGGGDGLTIASDRLRGRIDFIRAKGDIAGKISTYSVLYEGSFRMYKDDVNSYALSDHLPILGEFQL